MSTNKKIAVGVIGIIILVFVVCCIHWSTGGMIESDTANQIVTQGEVVPGEPSNPDVVSARDSSNDSLEKDSASIDAELKALESESSNIDEGMNDEPLPAA